MLHTDRAYESELTTLRDRVLLMNRRVEAMVVSSMHALAERDVNLARSTIDQDSAIDLLELEVDERCMRLFVRRQPVAGDLRFIATTLKLVTDVERVADLGVNICERVIELGNEPPLPLVASVQHIAEAALGMLHDAFDSFSEGDVLKAGRVLGQDQLVDALYSQLISDLIGFMMNNPEAVSRAARLQSIGKHLERIGDHATNIAEMVVFIVQGQDIRHAASAPKTYEPSRNQH